MEFTYIIDETHVRTGAKRHLWNRYKKTYGIRFFIMLVSIGIGLFNLGRDSSIGIIFLAGGIGGGIALSYQVLSWPSRSLKLVFMKDPEPKTILIRSEKDGLFNESKNGSAHIKWGAFLEWKSYDDGVLLYVQKNSPMWIPVTATFAKGNWDEFIGLLARNLPQP